MGYQDVKEMLKDARNLATGANDYQTVQLLKDIQLEVYDLIDENRDLRLEIEELKNKKNYEKDLEFKGSYYSRKTDNRKICLRCFDERGNSISLLDNDQFYYYCPVCKFLYEKADN